MAFTNERPLSVDGTRLDTLAYNIESIDGRRQLPGVRSNDVVVPGRHGVVPSIYDDFEPGRITLRMWVRSTDVNGDTVSGKHPKDQLSLNLDRLFALFRPRNRLLTVTQQVGTDTIARSNYLDNPRLDKSSSTSTVRTNYIVNPSMDRTTGTTVYRTNRITNPSFETTTAGWSVANATLARVTGGTPDVSWSDWRGEFTATTPAPLLSSGAVAASVGVNYTASVYVAALQSTGVQGGDPQLQVGIRWIGPGPGFAILSEEWADPVEIVPDFQAAISAPAWQRIFVDGQAVVGTDTARLVVRAVPAVNGTPVAAGMRFCVDGALFEDPVDDNVYFDGDAPSYGIVQWTGTANLSTSQALRAVVSNWASPAGVGTPFISGSSTTPAFGTACMVWRGTALVQEQSPILWHNSSLPNDNLGSRWSASIYVRTEMDNPPRLGLRIAGVDASDNFIAYLTGSNITGSKPAEKVMYPTAAWTRYELRGAYTTFLPAGVVKVRVEIVAVDDVEDGAMFLFDAATLEPLATSPHYFDGDSGDTAGFAYSWAGLADNSYSLMKGGTVDNWTPTRGTLTHDPTPDSFAVAASRACGRYVVTSNSGGISFSNFLFSETTLFPPGTALNAGAYIKGGVGIEMAQVAIEAFNGGTSVQIARGVAVNTLSDGWTWVPGAAMITPSGSDRVRMNIHLWEADGTVPPAGAVALISGAALVSGSGEVGYFDETTGGTVTKPGRVDKLPDIRQAICKTDTAIEASDAVVTVDGGYSQRFSVSLMMPDVFWRDPGDIYWQSNNQPTNRLRTYEITPLAGATAPIEDGIFVVIGPATNPYLRDPETGWFVKYRGTLPTGQSWKVDTGRYLSGVAKTGTAWNSPNWRNVIGQTDYESGRARMLTLHPVWNEDRQNHLVRIQMYGGIRMYTIARRKYL